MITAVPTSTARHCGEEGASVDNELEGSSRRADARADRIVAVSPSRALHVLEATAVVAHHVCARRDHTETSRAGCQRWQPAATVDGKELLKDGASQYSVYGRSPTATTLRKHEPG